MIQLYHVGSGQRTRGKTKKLPENPCRCWQYLREFVDNIMILKYEKNRFDVNGIYRLRFDVYYLYHIDIIPLQGEKVEGYRENV